MSVLVNIIILVLQCYLLFKSIQSLKKNFLNFSALIYLMYFVFSIPIFWDMYLELDIFKYVYKITSEYNIVASDWSLTYFNFISFLIHGMFFWGYNNAKFPSNDEKTVVVDSKRYVILQIVLISLLSILLLNSMLRYDGNILLYFTPSSKSIYGSFYEKYLILTIPYLLFTIKVFYDYYKNKKIKKSIIFYIIALVLITSSTGQRREIITAVIYMGLLLISLSENKGVNFSKPSKKIIILGISSVILIFVTWYMRGLFSQIQGGSGNIQLPWKSRGIIEVIFGSSSTGYPTTIALHNFYKLDGYPYFRQVAYFIQSFIPRAIFENKLISLTEFVQTQINAKSNLSLFYVNDIYFTFGFFGIFISYYVGKLFSYIYNGFLNNKVVLSRCYAFIMFSLIIMFYKNGLVEFMIRFTFVFILMKLCLSYVFNTKNKKIKNIMVIGNFGIDGKLNGQTARTRTIFKSLEKKYTKCSILKVDTSKRNLKSLFNVIYYLIKSDIIVIMPAQKSLLYICLLIKFFNKSDRTIYVVIGGWLYDKINNKPIIISELKKYKGILVQVEQLKKKLEKLKLKNVKVFPNYRISSGLENKKYEKNNFIFYSRVREDKGIQVAIDAIELARKETHKDLKLHIYGPIDYDYEQQFKTIIKNKKYVKYCGVLNEPNIIDKISQYNALLFPTYYDGEGFPGAVLEAVMAGIPVLASDWKYNRDVIKDRENGLIHDTKNSRNLANDILELLKNNELNQTIRKNNVEMSKKYSENEIFPILSTLIESECED